MRVERSGWVQGLARGDPGLEIVGIRELGNTLLGALKRGSAVQIDAIEAAGPLLVTAYQELGMSNSSGSKVLRGERKKKKRSV